MPSEKKYEPLLNGAEPMAGEEITLDDDKTLDYPAILPRSRRNHLRTVRILVGLNVVLATLLFLVVGFWWRENAKMPTPPHCKLNTPGLNIILSSGSTNCS